MDMATRWDPLRTDSKVTIKDISRRLNVSTVSVHRALSGKEGVSADLRGRILKTANEMGYEVNYAASSLKRKPSRLAVILPVDGGLYFDYFWKGVEDYEREATKLNVQVEKYVCRDEMHQYELLKQVADEEEPCAGVVTFSYTRNPKVLLQLQRLVARKIVTIMIDDEMDEPEGVYSIPPNECAVGALAGEFIALITPQRGTVILSSGRLTSGTHQRKRQSFIQRLHEDRPELRIHVVEGFSSRAEDAERRRQEFCRAMEQFDDLVACYAMTATDSALMADAVRRVGLEGRVKLVGTDLNEITTQMLTEGRLTAVIDQSAYAKGYIGLELLVDRTVKNKELPLRVDTPIKVILRSNLSFFGRLNNIMTWR